MRVLALTKYGARAASTRQRFLQFFPGLERSGIQVTARPLLSDRYLTHRFASPLRSAPHAVRGYVRRLLEMLQPQRFDLHWIHFELLPFLPVDAQHLLFPRSQPFAIDLDDANFHKYDLSSNPCVRRLLGSKFERLLSTASAVIAGSPYLVQYASQFNSNVHRIPTVVDTDQIPYRPREDAEVPIVGWIGSPSTTRYLRALREPLAALAECHRYRLLTIGAEALDWTDVPVEQHDWSIDTEVDLLGRIDIGVMPLTDDPWSRGKCGYKLIQYLASGAPVVASPVGANLEIVDPGCGLFADDPGAWVEALSRLLTDADARRAMGRSGRDKMVRQYSLASQTPGLERALRSALGR